MALLHTINETQPIRPCSINERKNMSSMAVQLAKSGPELLVVDKDVPVPAPKWEACLPALVPDVAGPNVYYCVM